MVQPRNVMKNLRIKDWLQVDGTFSGNSSTPGQTYYVDRNKDGSVSGDGKSWGAAFLTIGEAITAVNSDYTKASAPSEGRNRHILIGEGWYSEVPLVLTANDVTIIGVAPGSHDQTVLYGSSSAGSWAGPSGGPALQLTCSNCTIMNMCFMNQDPLYAAVQDGGAAADGHLSAVANSYNNRFINCSFVRDTADGELGGIDIASNEGPVIDNCRFSTSCKDWGIRIRTNGVTNPVGVEITNCHFVGTPTGIKADAGGNFLIDRNFFYDDTTDRADETDYPLVAATAGRIMMTDNYFEGASADLVTGAAAGTFEINNHTGS